MDAARLIQDFETEHPLAVRLAEAVSLAVLVDPPLLRRARRELVPEADPGTEADLWSSPLVQSRSPDGFVLLPDAAQRLRERLRDSGRLDKAWELTRYVHGHFSPALKLEEEIAWLSVSSSPDSAARIVELLQSALVALVVGERRGLAHWAARVLPALPSKVRSLEAVRLLDAGARLRLGGDARSLHGKRHENLAWIVPADLPRVPIRVRLLDGAVELDTNAKDGNLLYLPETDPLLVDLLWEDEKALQVTLRRGERITIPVSGSRFLLWPILGEVYELRAEDQSPEVVGASELHAIFIGIDDHIPDRLPNGTHYPSLRGAVKDVSRMASFLRDHYKLKPEKMKMLLSRAGADGAHIEPPDRRPTYANIVAAFKQLASEAKPGDRVYIHYCGQGVRGPTEYPEVKGPDGMDEALVPCDIGDPSSRYLRDLELTALFRHLTDQGLLVTVVLDCCHSGGIAKVSRGEAGAVPRGLPWVPRTSIPSAVTKLETVEALKDLHGEMPVIRYSLFTACRPDELAFEFPFEGRERQGVLSYFLLDILRRSVVELSCGEIHQRLVARIRGRFMFQTPMFLGDRDRAFLGTVEDVSMRTFTREGPVVLRVGDDGWVLVDVGVAMGARVGDRVLLKESAELMIRHVGATESWAEVTRVLGEETIEPGAKAELLRRKVVRLVPPERRNGEEKALVHLRDALLQIENEFIEVGESDMAPDLCVTINENNSYQIMDPGGIPYPNVEPLPVIAPNAVRRLMRQLDHLARFQYLLTVENLHPPEWLGIGLELRQDDQEGAQFQRHLGTVDMKVEESLTVRIINRSSVRLDLAVLDLAPDYSVTQILPERGSLSLLPLDPGQVEELHIQVWLPPSYDAGNDILKVFATRGAASFRWLELPPLGLSRTVRQEIPRVVKASPPQMEDGLESGGSVPPILQRPSTTSGGLTVSEFPEEEWITAQVEIRVRR